MVFLIDTAEISKGKCVYFNSNIIFGSSIVPVTHRFISSDVRPQEEVLGDAPLSYNYNSNSLRLCRLNCVTGIKQITPRRHFDVSNNLHKQ